MDQKTRPTRSLKPTRPARLARSTVEPVAKRTLKVPEALPTEEIMAALKADDLVIGDGHLVDRPDNIPDLAARFLTVRDKWVRAENPDLVTPEYLKSIEAYRTK